MKKKGPPKTGLRCTCNVCGVIFFRESLRKYCDAHRDESRKAQLSKIGKNRTPPLRQSKACEQCGAEFKFSPSQDRKYCSYKCHLDSGGALRAGKASGGMMRKYGVKKDHNHADMVEAFRKLGVSVLDLSTMGRGVPDLIVWCCQRYLLVDVKNRKTGYGRRGLNKNQKEWADDWTGGPVYLVYDLDDVIALANGNFDFVKKYPDDRAHPERSPLPDGVTYIRMITNSDGSISEEYA